MSASQDATARPTAEGWYEVKWEPDSEWTRVFLFEGGETWGFHENDDPESVELDVDSAKTLWRSAT
jgi:hypothetical protein